MRRKTITKAQKLALHNARMLLFALQDKIYAAGDGSMTFSECRAAADPSLALEYVQARSNLSNMECDLVNDGRAYWGSFGALQPIIW